MDNSLSLPPTPTSVPTRLLDVMESPTLLDAFGMFCDEEMARENLDFWVDATAFQRIESQVSGICGSGIPHFPCGECVTELVETNGKDHDQCRYEKPSGILKKHIDRQTFDDG